MHSIRISATAACDDYFLTLKWLFDQDPRAYQLYRDRIFCYLEEISGRHVVYEELLELIEELEIKSPQAMKDFWEEYKDPNRFFSSQWQNLFEINFKTPLICHENLQIYQQKYEVALFLEFLSQLTKIKKEGSFDKNLENLKNKNGRLLKKNTISFISARLKSKPNLKKYWKDAYNFELRNMIGHNAYQLETDKIVSIDGGLSITENEFQDSLFAIQTIQNSIKWILTHERNPVRSLGKFGILGCAFYGFTGKDTPSLVAYQLEPFFNIDKKFGWLKSVSVTTTLDKLITKIGDSQEIACHLQEEIVNTVKNLASKSPVLIRLIPVMPWVGNGGQVLKNDFGQFKQYGNHADIMVEFKVCF